MDPMHNLFLGITKYFLGDIWLDKGQLINFLSFKSVSTDSRYIPSDIGHIPYKIASGFSSFTADQFKNWIVHCQALDITDHLKQ